MVDVLAFFPLLWIFYQLLILGLGLWDVLHLCWDPAEGFVVMDVSGLMNQIPKCFVWRSELRSSKLGGAATPNPVLDTNPLFQTLSCARPPPPKRLGIGLPETPPSFPEETSRVTRNFLLPPFSPSLLSPRKEFLPSGGYFGFALAAKSISFWGGGVSTREFNPPLGC